MSSWRILEGDCRDVLASLDAQSVQTCVTSPPYFGLRDYGTGEWEGGDSDHEHHGTHGAGGGSSKNGAGRPGMGGREHVNGAPSRGGDPSRCPCGARRVDRQIGLEPTPDEFVEALVGVFREVRRVLRDDGTVWLNLGDSYNAYNGGAGPGSKLSQTASAQRPQLETGYGLRWKGAKPKDLLGIPWMVAFALRADGWYLRSDIIWAKPNPMPESVTDRPTKSHEYVFLLSKGPRYWYDADAIREDMAEASEARYAYSFGGPKAETLTAEERNGAGTRTHPIGSREPTAGRNRRSVWTVATQPYPGAHFATFPPKLIEPCILAGCPERACGVCGAPWTRVVERESRPNWAPDGDHGQKHDGTHYRPNIGGGVGNDRRARRDIGWQPSCGHHAPAVPGVVLDPFAGAGTTGMVALRHGRSFVGIELNPEYAALARDRIIEDCPLHNAAAAA